MTESVNEDRLSSTDLEAEAGSTLPDKEAMSLLDDGLLNLDVTVDLDANAAAPVDAAVAANANVAAPIDAAVSANLAANDSQSAAVASQTSVINQDLDGVAIATTDQDAAITQ